MNLLNSNCSDVRRNLPRQDELDAIERGLLDIHLRRCAVCARIAEDYSKIERGSATHEGISEEWQRDIYNRLVPAVHEITSRVPPPPPGRLGVSFGIGMSSRYWMMALVGLAMAACAIGLYLQKLL